MKLNEFNNIKYYIGENAEDNWDLFEKSKEINENYIWFHLNSFSSPYVIMYALYIGCSMDFALQGLWPPHWRFASSIFQRNLTG